MMWHLYRPLQLSTPENDTGIVYGIISRSFFKLYQDMKFVIFSISNNHEMEGVDFMAVSSALGYPVSRDPQRRETGRLYCTILRL